MFKNGNGHDKGLTSLYDPIKSSGRTPDSGMKDAIANEVIDQVNREFPVEVLRSPTDADRQRIQERINTLVALAYRRNDVYGAYQADGELGAELGRRLMGLGFLDLLLPPARTDLSEICIYSSGLVQVMKKNSVRWETVPEMKPDPAEINRVLDRLLGPQNKSINEANPSINAKLPSTPHNPGGGRVKALHPVIVPPGRNPSVNLRLFEQKPVRPEWILERGMMSQEMMDLLKKAIEEGYRILITGGRAPARPPSSRPCATSCPRPGGLSRSRTPRRSGSTGQPFRRLKPDLPPSAPRSNLTPWPMGWTTLCVCLPTT